MAFFKFRKGADDSSSAPAKAPSIEAIRQRAKYRLVGATVLVLVGVVGLPLLFDKQPRPIAVDTPIVIPDKNNQPPLRIPAPVSPVGVEAEQVAPAPAVIAQPGAASVEGVITETQEPAKPLSPAMPKPTTDSANASVAGSDTAPQRPVRAPAVAAASKPTEAARAQALLEGKPIPNPAPPAKSTDDKAATVEGRFIVQVGAFTENARAQEVRMKVERAGLKTYTQIADTKDGKRIRVRVGPFGTKAEAEKAADKLRKLNLPAALLTL